MIRKPSSPTTNAGLLASDSLTLVNVCILAPTHIHTHTHTHTHKLAWARRGLFWPPRTQILTSSWHRRHRGGFRLSTGTFTGSYISAARQVPCPWMPAQNLLWTYALPRTCSQFPSPLMVLNNSPWSFRRLHPFFPQLFNFLQKLVYHTGVPLDASIAYNTSIPETTHTTKTHTVNPNKHSAFQRKSWTQASCPSCNWKGYNTQHNATSSSSPMAHEPDSSWETVQEWEKGVKFPAWF